MDVAFREIGGYRTRMLTVAGEGLPILLFHGFSDHAAGWRPFMRALETQGRSAIAVDLPGFGRAADLGPGEVIAQLAHFTAEAIKLVAAEHDLPVVVIGNSLGGAAIWAAAQEPGLPVAGIVAIAPAGFGFTRPVRAFRRAYKKVPLQAVLRPLPMPAVRWVLLAFYAMGSGAGRRLDPAVGRAWVGQFHDREDLRRTLDLVHRVLAEIDQIAQLPAPGYPLLMMWGARDRLVFPRAGHVDGVETKVLARGGHCPQLTDAESLAGEILGFSDRVAISAQEPVEPPSWMEEG